MTGGGDLTQAANRGTTNIEHEIAKTSRSAGATSDTARRTFQGGITMRTRRKKPKFSGDEVFPDDYADGFQGCYEVMRELCMYVFRFNAENMRCEYAQPKGSRFLCEISPCAPHFTKCPRLFMPRAEKWRPPKP